MITKRLLAILIGIYIIYRGVVDYLLYIYDVFISPFTINAIFFVATVALIIGYMMYIQQYTENMKIVERYLRNNSRALFKTVQERYNSFLWHYTNDDLEKAEEELNQIKGKRHESIRAVGMTTIYINENNLEEALKEIEKIKNPNLDQIKYYQLAHVAILKDDWNTFETTMGEIKDEKRKYALKADAAFRKGNFPKAREFGDLALKHTKGVQKYLLLKDLERQKNNPNRKTYF
ncbi:tetratricopeptide repeat protein [Natronincola ferrireducens]|uniref:Tetratricopeptide repeat-containing protein n=1 Tax=Natronincola ferrireducens TaxID=393762 RepID=A0A1G9A9K5_9FIRM|nr:hypothetical protein [Natronincola ferrireducens]SDK24046.1 hypothetical protein SAMN05660472_01102 [Natronincola ferrireducens]